MSLWVSVIISLSSVLYYYFTFTRAIQSNALLFLPSLRSIWPRNDTSSIMTSDRTCTFVSDQIAATQNIRTEILAMTCCPVHVQTRTKAPLSRAAVSFNWGG